MEQISVVRLQFCFERALAEAGILPHSVDRAEAGTLPRGFGIVTARFFFPLKL